MSMKSPDAERPVQLDVVPAAPALDPSARLVQQSAARQGQSAHVVQRIGGASTRSAPVQRAGGGAAAVHRAAAHGVRGGGGAIPHQEAIQRSFGRHDVSGIRAHVGGPAREASEAMGANAYATGDAVAFKAAPDLHTAAHEAAHVVQQQGGVQLEGGVGKVGDPYEQHADAVADRVVQGRSAEGLLDRYAGGSGGARGPVQQSGGPAVQLDPEDGAQGADAGPLDATSVDAAMGPGFYAEWMAAQTRSDEARARVDALGPALPADVRARLTDPHLELVAQGWRTYFAIEAAVSAHEASGEVSDDDSPDAAPDPGGGADLAAPAYTEYDNLLDQLDGFEPVVNAWSALVQAQVWEVFARIGEMRLEQARTLVNTTLPGLEREIRAVQVLIRQYDAQLGEAFAQAGINASLTAGVALIGVFTGPVGIVIGIAAAGFSMWLDRQLGPSAGGLSDAAAVTGAIPRMSAVGAVMGTAADLMEINESIENYEQITALRARLRNLRARWQRAQRDLQQLAPFIRNAALAETLIAGIRAHAEVLRGQGGAAGG